MTTVTPVPFRSLTAEQALALAIDQALKQLDDDNEAALNPFVKP
jgi:hypothetical protein